MGLWEGVEREMESAGAASWEAIVVVQARVDGGRENGEKWMTSRAIRQIRQELFPGCADGSDEEAKERSIRMTPRLLGVNGGGAIT